MASVKLREKKIVNGISLYLDIYNEGKRSYEFLHKIMKNESTEARKQKKEIANTIRSQREIELISKGTSFVPKHRKNIDFLQYYKHYLANYKKRDIRMIRYSMEKFIKFVGKETLPVNELDEKLCEGFIHYLKTNAGLNGETPQNYYARFKKVIREAIRDNVLHENPIENIIFKNSDDSTKLKKQVLTIDELKILKKVTCGNDEIKRAFLFACSSGLGIAELRELKWKNINDNRLKTYRQKTGNEVNIQLSNTAIELLGKRHENESEIFNLNYSDVNISRVLKNWIKKAEIEKNISFYCGRHTYAVNLLKNGANLKTVSDAMGHSNTRHTVKYLNYVDSLKDTATSNLNF
ncbi:MAG: site-specific integrase [Bacteroidales bacterium]|jgi:site-specific recombinase XerD|nr:site-specific integrase [Bacteroidales bacterium]